MPRSTIRRGTRSCRRPSTRKAAAIRKAGGYPPPYPGYPAYDPYRAGKPLGTNGKAIASLVTALGGLVFCGLPSIAGLILGIIAMRECKRTGQDGYGLALAGTIVGALVTVMIALYFILLFGLAASGWQWAP